jgi:hypothetical protein
LTYQQLAADAPTSLTTMQGAPLKVRYRHGRVVLIDVDSASPNAHIIWAERNLNEGNRQLAQGVSSIVSPVAE